MFKKAMIAGAVVLASVGANAATANMTITGTITPEACAVTLGNGGAVDYGNLSSAAVKTYGTYAGTNAVYLAPVKSVSIDVSCSAPTAVALNWTDNRAASRLAIDSADTARFGLGVSGTTNIGSYNLNLVGAQLKTAAAATAAAHAGVLTRAKNAGTGAWTVNAAAGAGFGVNTTQAFGFKAVAADTTPAPVVQITGQMQVQPYFNKALVDSATSVITLDGSNTVSVEYI